MVFTRKESFFLQGSQFDKSLFQYIQCMCVISIVQCFIHEVVLCRETLPVTPTVRFTGIHTHMNFMKNSAKKIFSKLTIAIINSPLKTPDLQDFVVQMLVDIDKDRILHHSRMDSHLGLKEADDIALRSPRM